MAETTNSAGTNLPTLPSQPGNASTPSKAPSSALQSDPDMFAHISEQMETRLARSPIYGFLFRSQLRLTHASKGLVLARLPLSADHHLNGAGGLHGAVSAAIVDWAGGSAIAAWDRRDRTGVSVDINISYLSVARLGDEIEIEGRVDRVGGSLAYTSVGIYKVDAHGRRGETVALGRHTKFVRSR